MTSFAETHPQIQSTLGGPVSLQAIRRAALLFFRRLSARCGAGCSSGGSGAAQCPDVENISLENLRSNLMSNSSTPGPTTSLANIVCAPQPNRGGYPPSFGSLPGSAAGLGSNAFALSNYTTSTLNATGAMTSFTFNTTRGSSPRSSLGASTQRGSIASTMSATLRKPSGSTLISLAGMLAERDTAGVAAIAASPSSSGQAMSGATSLNSSAPVFRERRSSRGSESQDREWERETRLRGVVPESSSTYAGPVRQRSSSSRSGEEERRGARERNRRRERDRRESRLDRLESLDTIDRVLSEQMQPFVDTHIRLNQRVKVRLHFSNFALLI